MSGGHVKLGIFVIVAVMLLVTMLLLLGALQSLKPTVTIETYFAENIQGLRPGAAVRYRGVDVGTVGRVAFAVAVYPEAGDRDIDVFGQDILVELTVDKSVFSRLKMTDIPARLQAAVDQGLRARLASSGLGGPTFVELNYLDPVRFSAPSPPWTPNHILIPSAPSQIASVIRSLESILHDVDQSQLIESLAALTELAPEIGRLINTLQDSDVLSTASSSLQELRAASVEIQRLLADQRIGGLLDEASTTMQSVRSLLDEVAARDLMTELTTMADALESAAGTLDRLGQTVEQTELLAKLRDMAGDLGPAGRDLSDLAGRLERLVGTNDTGIADTIQSLRRTALQIEALLEEAQANPSRIIFGDPPPRRTTGGSP